MGGLFRKIGKLVGAALFFVPGLQGVGAALIIGTSALDAIAQRKQARQLQNALESRASAQTITVKNPLVSRKLVYGRTRVGGVIAHMATSDDNKFLYLVVVFCQGPIDAIEDVYLDDEKVRFDADGVATRLNGTGKYNNKIRIQKHVGTDAQAADSDLVSDLSEWTSDHRLRGIAYLGMRLRFDPAVYPNGLPNISAVIRGKNDILDGRDDSTGYTNNPALCLADYMSLTPFGLNVDIASEINQDEWDAAANVCDEEVDVEAAGLVGIDDTDWAIDKKRWETSSAHELHAGQIIEFSVSGTLPSPFLTGTDYHLKNVTETKFELSTSRDGDVQAYTTIGTGTYWTYTAKEYRYTFNGVVSLEDSPEDIIRLFRDSMAGTVAYIGGKWSINAGAYIAPTFTIDEDTLVGPVKFKPRRDKRSRFNTVKGFFLAEIARWQATDYPPVSSSSYVTADGEELVQPLDLPATSTPSMANRIARILLRKARLERSVDLECNIEALEVRAGGTVSVNLPRYGLSNVPFDVDGFDIDVESGTMKVSLKLSETASSIYDWDSATDEQEFIVTPAPDLSDGTPEVPSGLTLTNNQDQRSLVSVRVEWDAATDEFVISGGNVIVEYKESSGTEWVSQLLSPTATQYDARGLRPNTLYDFRIAFRNQWGGQSDWVLEEDHLTAAATTSSWAYIHVQTVPSTTWTIEHNLGYRPSVGAIFDSTGTQMTGLEQQGTISNPTGTLQFTITFNSAVSGTAFLS